MAQSELKLTSNTETGNTRADSTPPLFCPYGMPPPLDLDEYKDAFEV